MDPKSLVLGSDHVLNIMSQEQEFNIPSNPGPKTASEPIENNIPGTPGRRTISKVVASANDLNTTQEPKATDANANTPVPPTFGRKPNRSLLSAGNKEYMEICVLLYEAAITGDWEAAKVILDRRPELVRFAITPNDNVTLHIAVSAKATEQSNIFVENLVNMMGIEDLEIENQSDELAYMIAAATGNVHMFEVMVVKHKDLLSRFPEKTLEAQEVSAINGNRDMTLHLYNVLGETHPSSWIDVEWCWFFIYCIHGELFDIALEVLKDHEIIGTSYKMCFDSLEILARRPDTLNRTETDTNMIWRIADSILAFFHVKKNSTPEMGNQALKKKKALELVQSLLKLYPISMSGQRDILYEPAKESLQMR